MLCSTRMLCIEAEQYLISFFVLFFLYGEICETYNPMQLLKKTSFLFFPVKKEYEKRICQMKLTGTKYLSYDLASFFEWIRLQVTFLCLFLNLYIVVGKYREKGIHEQVNIVIIFLWKWLIENHYQLLWTVSINVIVFSPVNIRFWICMN